MTRHILALLSATCLFIGLTTSVHGDVIEFGGLSDTPQDLSVSLGSGDFSLGPGVVYTESGVSLTTGEIFDYTVTVTPVSGVTDIILVGQSLGDDSSSITPPIDGEDDRFQDGSTINIDVAVTSGNVQFDGFTNFGLDLLAPGEVSGFTIDGVDYLRGGMGINGDNDPRFGIAITGGIIPQNNIDIAFIDMRGPDTVEGTALRGFALQFSPVPEPSSSALALFSLIGLGFASRRRRK